MNRLQNDYDTQLQSIDQPLSLKAMAELLDDLDNQMSIFDIQREKKIFITRIREEWEDAFIKKYLQRGGDMGPSLNS